MRRRRDFRVGRLVSCWLTVAFMTILGMPGEAMAQITGATAPPVNQEPPRRGAGVNATISIIPTGPTELGNCIPLGNNTDFGFTGIIYRNVPPFTIMPGSGISFDVGNPNDVDIRRNIYFAQANANPGPPVVFGINIVSQGIRALAWTQVVSDAQTPADPRGNAFAGDYELRFTAEAPFVFPGGGLIVGFSGSPPAGFPDNTCDGSLVLTTATDPSGFFYGRFFFRPELSLDVLDDLPQGSGNGVALGGMVIREDVTPVLSSSWGRLKSHYR